MEDSTRNTRQFDFNGNSVIGGGVVSAFSAYNLLRNCNYFLNKQHQDFTAKLLPSVPQSRHSVSSTLPDDVFGFNQEKIEFSPLPFLPSSTVFSYPPQNFQVQKDEHLLSSPITRAPSPNLNGSSTLLNAINMRRPRGEKKPIPEDLKDEKYFERRKRNNQAAKKSRDARKMREDQIALRATILEHENAILRAQVLTLREESSSLRRLLFQKKAIEVPIRSSLPFGDQKII